MLAGTDDHYRLIFKDINTTPFIYYAVRIIIFLFLNFIIYYSIRLNEHQQLFNERINKSLLNTGNHLEAVNAELQAQRNAINNSASLIITDELEQIITANNNFLAISGYALDELKGKTPVFLLSEFYDEVYIKNITKTIESGNIWRGELKNRRKDGSHFWMQTAISTIYDSNKKQKGYLSMMFDITKLKSDEERLEKINYEKDRILYAVAHDLKNPLINFKTLLDMIKSGSVEEEEEQEIFRILGQDCDHSIDLIAELLEIGRLEDENFVLTKDTVELNSFLDQSLRQHEQAALKKDIKLIKAFDKNIGTIKINEKEFIRVIHNLISNATKFTPSGGNIKIETKHVTDNEISIEISDSGIGISKELLPIIFDKFSKAGRRGVNGEKSTGLGMWIVKHIVGLHGGEISVMSRENKGTTFTIILPA
jgi:PAS domain S-box-containing protein